MAGQLICQDGVSVSQAVPNEITPGGYLLVHYLGEDPFAIGPGPDPWRPRWLEGYGAKAPAPDWQVNADAGAEILVCMRMGPSPGEPYLYVEVSHGAEVSLHITASSDGVETAEIEVPIPADSISELRVLMLSGQVIVANQDGTTLVAVTAAEIAELFVTSPEPFDAALMFPYAFDAFTSGNAHGSGLRKVYYNGIGEPAEGFWADLILCSEIP